MSNQCRFCQTELKHSFCDLGMSPLSNSYIKEENSQKMEAFYPLHAYVCDSCFLVQLDEFESPKEIFSDYAYFSSYSKSWLVHAKNYVNMISKRFSFNDSSLVIEIASNDGYLLQYFNEINVPVLGIEPAKNVAKVAEDSGIPTEVNFFGIDVAKELVASGRMADLLLGNNVLAHVPDINDFVGGMKLVLKETGVITMEFPHLLQLINGNQFDTIYHEHFSYLSLLTTEKIFATHGLAIFDVDELPTHGGSLRIYVKHDSDMTKEPTANLERLREMERLYKLDDLQPYLDFIEKVKEVKCKLLEFLINAKREGKTVVSYGAPAKGNTLLNYCGVGTDFIDYTVDLSPHKQGCLLPGTHIPIRSPDEISITKPDYLLILPWNLKDEVMSQMKCIREWGGQFVLPIPELTVLP